MKFCVRSDFDVSAHFWNSWIINIEEGRASIKSLGLYGLFLYQIGQKLTYLSLEDKIMFQ